MCCSRFSTCARTLWWRPSWLPERSRFTAGFTISSPATFVAAGGIASSSRISMTIMRRRLLGLLRPDVFVWCLGGVWAGWGYLLSGKKELASLRHLFFLREGIPTPPFQTLASHAKTPPLIPIRPVRPRGRARRHVLLPPGQSGLAAGRSRH